MKPPLRLLIGVAVGVALMVGGVPLLRQALADRDVLYQGRPFDFWRDQLTNRDSAVSAQATTVVRDIIVPQLTNRMFADTNDSRLRLLVIEQLDQLPGRPVAFLQADGRRVLAVGDLATLGPTAQGAVPALLTALRGGDEMLLGPAAGALVEVQAEAEVAVPALIACMVTEEGHGRPEVVEALGEYGPKAKAAVPSLVKLLTDFSSKEIRTAAPKALKRIDPEAAAKAGVQ